MVGVNTGAIVTNAGNKGLKPGYALKKNKSIIQTPNTTTPTPQQTSTNIPVPNYGDVNGASTANYNTNPGTVQTATNTTPNSDLFQFGDTARQREASSPGFLTQRNDVLAQGFFKQGKTNSSDIYDELNKVPGFSTQSIEDKQNTAQAIANRIASMGPQTNQSSADDYFNQLFKKGGVDNSIANQAVDRAVGDYATSLDYGTKTSFDRPNQDLQNNFDRNKISIQRNIEDLDTNIKNQIDDVTRQAQRNVDLVDKQGALAGFNRSSGYIQGIQNIHDDSQRAVQRLQDLANTMHGRSAEDLAMITKQFNQDTARVKEDFDYQYRSLLDQRQVDLNSIVQKYGLSSDKLNGALQDLTVNTLQGIQTLENSYYDGIGKQVSNLNSYIDGMTKQQNLNELQFERARNFLDQNDGANLASLSYSGLQDLVDKGQLSPQDQELYKVGIANKTYNTLKQYGTPTNEDVDFMNNALNQGYTPFQIASTLIQKNPDRYTANTGDKGFTLTQGQQRYDANGKLIAQYSESTTPSGETYNSVDKNSVDQGVQQLLTQYPDKTPGPRDGRCGQFVNDWLKGLGVSDTNLFKDPITDKKALINSKTPEVGSVAVMNSATSPQYGHVGVVTSVNQDGTVTIKSSNYKGDGLVRTDTIKASNILGYFNPTKQTTNNDTYSTAFDLISFDKPTTAAQEQKKFQTLVQKGDTNAINSKLIQLAYNNIQGADAKKEFQATQTMISSLKQIQSTLDTLKSKGVDTGILKGNYNELVNKLGKVGNKDISRLATSLKDQLDALRRGRSGAALTEQEVSFYDSLFPSAGKEYDLNTENINGLLDSRGFVLESYLSNAYTPEIAQQILGNGNKDTSGGNGAKITPASSKGR